MDDDDEEREELPPEERSLPEGELDMPLTLPLLPDDGLFTRSFSIEELPPLLPLLDEEEEGLLLGRLLLEEEEEETEDEVAGRISIPVSEEAWERRSMTDASLRFLDADDVFFEYEDEDEDDDEDDPCPLLLPPRCFLADEDPSLDEGESCFLFLEDEEDDPPFLSSLLLSSSERLLLMSLFLDEEDVPLVPPPNGMISMPPLIGFFDDKEAPPVVPMTGSLAPAIGVMDTEGLMSVTMVGGTRGEGFDECGGSLTEVEEPPLEEGL